MNKDNSFPVTLRSTPLIHVVDDAHSNIQLIGGLLSGEGYDVAVSMNGQEALSLWNEVCPDLILLDIQLPDADGIELCRTLKARPDFLTVPVIFLTARAAVGDVVRGLDAGAADYVTKPFESQVILARVRTHLALRKAYARISELRALLPICSSCQKIRDDRNNWRKVEDVLTEEGGHPVQSWFLS